MNHFTSAEWIDFVNRVASSQQIAAMQKHLDTDCKRCKEAVALWQKIRRVASHDISFQPPEQSVLAVRNAFATARWTPKTKKDGGALRLLFDSFLQPALAGTRSVGTRMRQMLYRADPYQVDIQVEGKAEGNRLTVTGQLLNVSSPGFAAREVQVTLSNRRGFVVHSTTNEFGEFKGEMENSGDLELSIPRPNEKPIIISLRNALDRMPGKRM